MIKFRLFKIKCPLGSKVPMLGWARETQSYPKKKKSHIKRSDHDIKNLIKWQPHNTKAFLVKQESYLSNLRKIGIAFAGSTSRYLRFFTLVC